LTIPTIGIGAGAGCSGQVQVVTDLLGMSAEFTPKHARHYVELYTIIKGAAEAYRSDVAAGAFPTREQSPQIDESALNEILGRTPADRADLAQVGGIPLDRDL
jgi:3-methyl-2-oxobutanoate hydroxymethyltransferase